jgi:DNA polymerase-1
MKMEPKEFIDTATKAGGFSFDIEHEGKLSIYQPGFKIHGCSFATHGVAFYETDLDKVQEIVSSLFPLDLYSVAYNLKYDVKCLKASKLIDYPTYPKRPYDPMIAINLLDENIRPGDLGLKTQVRERYNHVMMTFEDASIGGLNTPRFHEYSKEDAKWEYELYLDTLEELKNDGLLKVFERILMPASLLFADVELTGMYWDVTGSIELLRGFQKLRSQMEKEIKSEIGELNLNSGDQIAKRLFDELGYSTKGIQTTASGKRFSTDAEAMDILASRYPVCSKIRTYRTADKMIGTYVEPITRRALVDPNNRIHPNFWLTSATGRTRSDDPNLQNIPAWLDSNFKHLNIRKNFKASPGNSLIVEDLSQIELRICGHVTREPLFLGAYWRWKCTNCGSSGEERVKLLHSCPNCGCAEDEKILKPAYTGKAFWHGEDLHTQTTNNVKALKGDRQNGKMANFALIYNAGAYRLHSEYPSFSISEWEDVIEEYFKLHKFVKRWHLLLERQMKAGKPSVDIFGRKRRISKYEVSKAYKHSLNQYINFPIQASACELMLLSMSHLRFNWIKRGVWGKEINQLNFVHDEGIWECPTELAPKYAIEIRDQLENTVQLACPVRADPKIVQSWGEAKG